MDMIRLRRSFFCQSVAWVLWLALLLPLAQSAAMSHGYSHAGRSPSGQRDTEPALQLQLSHCDLCLAAAALGGGGLAAAGIGRFPPEGPGAVPREPVASVWQRPAPLAYRSRAPPISAD